MLMTSPSAHPLAHRQFVATVAATCLVEPEEVLIADPRGSLTPSQMVDRKLLVLLGSCSRSFHQSNLVPYSPLDRRRIEP
jgi:hypothetical protein